MHFIKLQLGDAIITIFTFTVNGSDYLVVPQIEVTFPVSSVNGTVQCTEIEIVDDRALEGEHNFTVEILSTNPPISADEPSKATVIILDNDGISHAFV